MDSSKIKPNIGVIGWYDKGNIGDESYKIAFPLLFPEFDFIFSDVLIPNCEAYILGGGDIVNEHYLHLLQNIANKHIMSATISKPYNLENFGNIAVRDMESVRNALTVNAQCIPDFAYVLKPDMERGKELIKLYFAKGDLYSKTIAIIINAHLLNDTSLKHRVKFEHFAYQLAQSIDDTSASFVFVPFGFNMPWDDRTSNSLIASKCKFYKKNAVIYDWLGVQDTLNVLAACDCVISTRLHASIFACLSSIPFIDITHNHKNKNFLETIQMTELSLPYNLINNEVLTEKIKLTINNAEIKDRLQKITAKQKNLVNEFTEKIRIV